MVVLDSVITHTSTWFLDREIHQLVSFYINYRLVKLHVLTGNLGITFVSGALSSDELLSWPLYLNIVIYIFFIFLYGVTV